ncbi:beta-lactamase-like protein [Xylariales sp. AK1849]|nr:beta-lactamase-like protein [Xylariales sp. AK1849]
MTPSIEPIQLPSGSVAKFSIIDTSTRISKFPSAATLSPPVDGFDQLPRAPSWSFLIESPTGKKAVFDLGVSKNGDHYPPAVEEMNKMMGLVIEAPKDVAQILKENEVSLDSISSIIWSHWHFDHIGDPSTFPDTTEIVVGPGFKEALLPTYPENEKGAICEETIRGKTIREVTFDGSFKYHQYNAMDFFGDGSFYLLDTPGHAIGHLCGLVRTTSNPDTFVMLGGDLCHNTGQIRPSKHKPFPEQVYFHPSQVSPSSSYSVCASSCFEAMQTKRGRAPDQPMFDAFMGHDLVTANLTLRKAHLPDAQENLLFFGAHDDSLLGLVDLFPNTANDWRSKGLKEKVHWAFLKELIPSIERYQ